MSIVSDSYHKDVNPSDGVVSQLESFLHDDGLREEDLNIAAKYKPTPCKKRRGSSLEDQLHLHKSKSQDGLIRPDNDLKYEKDDRSAN